jgi:hypothetical protein
MGIFTLGKHLHTICTWVKKTVIKTWNLYYFLGVKLCFFVVNICVLLLSIMVICEAITLVTNMKMPFVIAHSFWSPKKKIKNSHNSFQTKKNWWKFNLFQLIFAKLKLNERQQNSINFRLCNRPRIFINKVQLIFQCLLIISHLLYCHQILVVFYWREFEVF